ncbi:MAG: hypothetical protein H8E12_12840 [Rhodobacteraceae bacterium]|nr:hypothetical protein [Paracoccaceae bacterium]
MNIALPILLLVFGGLTLWILSESVLKWYIKTACIAIFCVFTIIFWSATHTFLGWAADGDSIPEKVKVHWVVIKEPNELLGEEGQIYVLLESVKEEGGGFIEQVFGYKSSRKVEPRLYGLPYSRELHEQMESIKKRLKQGQQVFGKLTDAGEKTGKAGKKGKKGEGQQKKGKGGSESQETDWQFHELLPSDFLQKPTE